MTIRRSFARSIILFVGLSIVGLASAAESVPPTASGAPGSAAADVFDDPWLTQDGPAVAEPEERPVERVVQAWRTAPPRPHAQSAALRRTRLEYGLGDLRAPAAIIASVHSEDEPALYTGLARDLAPGVPSVQIDHAFALWRAGDIGTSILTFGKAFWATVVSLPAQLWLLENVAQLLMVVLLSASVAFVLLAAIQVFPHAAHDLGDLLSGATPAFARFAALAALVVAPLSLGEGVLGVVVALFAVAFAYGGSRQRNALAMAAILLVIGLHPLAQVVRITTDLVDRDPIVRSTLAVLNGTESPADVERLEASFEEDLVAAHALAFRARRQSQEELSRKRLESLLARTPGDAVALANLANIEKRRGNNAAAIALYERAAEEARSPTLLYDLSQAYATAFRMDEYEATLVRAQGINDQEVAALSSLDDAELVADLGFPIGMLRDRLRVLALSERETSRAIEVLAPGRLGESWLLTSGAFALIALLSLLLASRWDHASQCARCGHRICTRCEETVWSEELCEDCHHLFQHPEATDPKLRMARLQALSERESRFDKIWLALSLMVPGMAGFAARRPDFAIFGLLLASWVAAWLAWPSGVQADPMLMGNAAVLAFAIPGALAALAYAGVVVFSLMLRKSR